MNKKFVCSVDAKRLIGRKSEDPVVAMDKKHWPFDIINEGGRPKIKVTYKGESKTFFPEEISSMVLTKMRETAEAYLGRVSLFGILEPRYAVISVGIEQIKFFWGFS